MTSSIRRSAASRKNGWARLVGLARSFIRLWAYGLGGLLLVSIVLMTAYSAAAGFFFNRPLAGDFEIVQFGVAVAVFCFLPLAQLARANVIVDIFTMRVPAKAKTVMDLLGALVAVAFAALLLWRMTDGMIDYYRHSEYTPIIGIPLWTAFPPILVSLFLLVIAALLSAGEIVGLVKATQHTDIPPGFE